MVAARLRRALCLLASLGAAAPLRAEPEAYDFGPRGSLLTGGALLVTAGERHTLGRFLDTSACRWCDTNSFDDWFLGGDYRPRRGWSRASDGLLVVGLGSALAASHSGFSGRGRENLGAVVSAVGSAVIVMQVAKGVAARRRPYAQVEPTGPRDNKSFFSGHAATAMAAAVAALEVRRHEGLRARRAWALGALSAAGTTAALRVAARKHYFTDVLAGAAVGWAAGRFVPRWLERPRGPEASAGSALAPAVVLPLVGRATGTGRLGIGVLSGGAQTGVGLSLSWR